MKNKWIDVNYRLPNNSDPILVWQHNLVDELCSRHQKAVFIEKFFKIYPHSEGGYYENKNDFIGLDLEGDRCQITHWMPLPKPPTHKI